MSQDTPDTTPGLAQTEQQTRDAYRQAMAQSAARQDAARQFIESHGASVVDGHAPVTGGEIGTG
jgi:hypothetical protein